MERARELGRSILLKARDGNGSSEEDKERPEQQRQRRRSWAEVVADSPSRTDTNPTKSQAGKPTETLATRRAEHGGPAPGMAGSPNRVFSAEDVAKLVELARKQLLREKEAQTGWYEVETKEVREREKTYARGLVEDFRRSPESDILCWQCNKTGHISSECPQGERCFRCNNTGHKRADCPKKKRAPWAEKGKGIATDTGARGDARSVVRAGNMWIRERDDNVAVEQQPWLSVRSNEEARRGQPGRVAREPGRGGGAPGRQWESNHDLKNKMNDKGVDGKTYENRVNTIAPVFLTQSERATEDRVTLRATGGIVVKINGNPTIKDYIEALKKMCSTYAAWNWVPKSMGESCFDSRQRGGWSFLPKGRSWLATMAIL